MTDARRRLRRMLGRVPGLLALARLVVSTVRICMRYRVTGLASEAGFFALLSLPPLILGLVGGLAYVANAIGPVRVDAVLDAVNNYASQFLTAGGHQGHPAPHDRGRRLGPALRPAVAGLRPLAVVGVAGPERLRRHHLDHVRPVRRAGHRPHPGAVVLAVPAGPRPGHRHHPARPARPEPARRDPPRGLGLADHAVLAAGHAADRRRPHQPLPHLDTATVAVAARRPRCGGDDGAVDRGLLRRPRHDRRVPRTGPPRSTARCPPRSCCSSGSTRWPSRCSSGPPPTRPSASCTRTRSSAPCTNGSARGSRSCGCAAPSGSERPAGWDDPFDGYGPGDDGDDLGLSGLREAARGPLTPMSGAGRSTPSTPQSPPANPVDAGSRVDVDR